MKNITSKVQRLSQRAAELKQFVEGVPPKLVEVRAAVKDATGQVQTLRADVIASVATLRAENDTQLIAALRELDAGAEVLVEAGCLLDRVDMDLGPTRRVVVNLERAENVDARRLKALIEANRERPVIHAVLAAILKADELSETVQLEELTFTKLSIDVGLIPAVRIGWTTNARRAVPAALGVPQVTPVAPASALGVAQSAPVVAQSSFFEQRSMPASVVAPASAAVSPVTLPVIPATPVAAAGGSVETATSILPPITVAATPVPAAPGDWRKGALDRFKKMPDLTKRSS